ncbi:TMV resistance protein N [Capsicum annuum]|uniref:TMV resistance protein N n=1 Tax=Capsicum annuum TaxID=4072 RepID=UPI001FB06421|nr:TMV resistance protein N [Capsicum annuum]
MKGRGSPTCYLELPLGSSNTDIGVWNSAVHRVEKRQVERFQKNLLSNVADGTKKFHFIHWKTVAYPKMWGGLGVTNLKVFNKTLLGGIEKTTTPAKIFDKIVVNLREREEFFEEILDKISVVPSIAKYHVGIKPRIEKVKSLLNVESGGVYFVGLWGLGGVGKTTIASGIFDEISSQFEGSCFLANVWSVLKKSELEVLQHLQQKLLSQILKKDSVNVPNFATGDEMISQMLRFKKVLIVLDDMDDSQQLEYLVGKRDWFGDGTKVITTTRNLDLLSKHDVLYRVPELTNHEALELFSWHAFQQGTPVEGFEELSCCVVDYAKGLPLALGVLGSFLYKQGTEEHINALYRGKDFRDGKIVRLLSLSLDALDDDYKNMFLHIACFLRGKRKEDVVTVLDELVDSRD